MFSAKANHMNLRVTFMFNLGIGNLMSFVIAIFVIKVLEGRVIRAYGILVLIALFVDIFIASIIYLDFYMLNYTFIGIGSIISYVLYFVATFQFMIELAKVELLQNFRKWFG
jgi:hypothetical protein